MIMKNTLCCITLVLALCSGGNVAGAASPTGENAERAAILKQVQTLMKADDYAGLDALSERYRRTAERTASGTWKLAHLHDGIATSFATRDKDPAIWDARVAWAERWVEHSPASPTARLAVVRALLGRAWSYRGGGYAHTVGADAWAPYARYSRQAAEYLVAHKSVSVSDPSWYQLAETVALREDWESAALLAVFDEGAARYPDYLPLYTQALVYYAPAWGGSEEAVESFAQRALAKVPKQRRAEVYTRMYLYHFGGILKRNPAEGSAIDWSLMRAGFKDLLARYPTDWNLQRAAQAACLGKDMPTTHALMAQIRGPADLSVWGNAERHQRCQVWAKSPPAAAGASQPKR